MFRIAPALTLTLFLGPVVAGLAGTLLPAFGVLPVLGLQEFSLSPWRELLQAPGFTRSLQLTLTAGFGATILSFVLAVGFCALGAERPLFRKLEHVLAPLLATPHVAVAIGLAFLIAPSGWIARALSPEITGWDRPPDVTTLRDAHGLSFLLGLVVKEVPFLVLMIIGATGQVAARPLMLTARSMGYSGPVAWTKAILPQIYRQIRLPLYAVLAFSLSVVEVALVLAPGNPPPLSVTAARWFSSYDLSLYRPAAAAAILQLALVVVGIGFWRICEVGAARIGLRWIMAGNRTGMAAIVLECAGWAALLAGLACAASIVSLALWSVAQEWRFPDILPQRWTWANWTRVDALLQPLVNTIVIGAIASLSAVALAVACLENEQRRGLKPGPNVLWLLYLPLLVPQIAFLFGVQILLVHTGLDGSLVAVIWSHLLFVLPYVFLSLSDPYRSLDPRYARVGAGLGASPLRIFALIKLPMLLTPLLIAFAVGFSVSVGQYLPTLFAGTGRVPTLTTEAVTLAGGGDRRLVGVTAFLQSILPLAVYVVAIRLPVLLFRNRRGLR